MKKNIFCMLVFLTFQFFCVAQKTRKLTFSSINQFGIAWGGTGDGLQLQTINGVAYKTYSAGLGIGLDYYWERTVPVFIDLRKNIFSAKQTPFVYADGGVSVPWIKENKEETWYKSNYSTGSYFDVGIGYRLPINKKLFANISFGYTQKKQREQRDNQMVIFDFAPYGQNHNEHYDYTLRRFSLKAGLSF
jgi:hypothetical protein